jgi:tRNA pseudouridine55 synthase
MIDGIVAVNKPVGVTSHDVVQIIRKKTNQKRIGHTGTLDPFASGVLLLLLGSTTRLARYFSHDTKQYEADIFFGAKTETGDHTGRVIEAANLGKKEIANFLSKTDWSNITGKFKGDILQRPPKYSAKKIGGRRSYQLAREGKDIELEPINVKINALEIVRIEENKVTIEVECSAGTYIRTLAEDIGKAVGLPAHLTRLERTRVGIFSISDAVSLDAESEELLAKVCSPAAALANMAKYCIADSRTKATLNGLSTRVVGQEFNEGQEVMILSSENVLLAIGIYDSIKKEVKPKIVLK